MKQTMLATKVIMNCYWYEKCDNKMAIHAENSMATVGVTAEFYSD